MDIKSQLIRCPTGLSIFRRCRLYQSGMEGILRSPLETRSATTVLSSSESQRTDGMSPDKCFCSDADNVVFRASNGPWHTEAESERFLNELRPHTLEHFEVISFNFLSSDSISGLSSHLSSLTELKLTSLGLNAIASLPSLTAPPALRALALTDSKVLVDNDLVESIVTHLGQWIHSCKSLKELHIRRFVLDPNTLLSQALANGGPRLTTLSLSDYAAAEAHEFHETLGSQKTLQNLYLNGEGMEPVEDNMHLVQAFAELNKIRVLELKGVSNGFTPDHVMALVALIPRVERLWIDGDYFDDSIWLAFRCLPKLRSLVIQALSEFSEQAIISFITKLKSGSHGFNLSIMNSITEAELSEDAQKSIRNILVSGSFEFGLAQGEYSYGSRIQRRW